MEQENAAPPADAAPNWQTGQRKRAVKVSREARLVVVADLYCKSQTLAAIGRTVGVSVGQVSKDLSAIRSTWKAEGVAKFDERVNRELAKLDYLERRAWEAYELSLEPEEITSSEQTTEGAGADASARTTIGAKRRNRNPDSKFMDVVTKCIDMRIRIMGGYAPAKSVAAVITAGQAEGAAAEQWGEFLKTCSDEDLELLQRINARYKAQAQGITLVGTATEPDA